MKSIECKQHTISIGCYTPFYSAYFHFCERNEEIMFSRTEIARMHISTSSHLINSNISTSSDFRMHHITHTNTHRNTMKQSQYKHPKIQRNSNILLHVTEIETRKHKKKIVERFFSLFENDISHKMFMILLA